MKSILIIYCIILFLGFGGWAANAIKFAKCDFQAPYKTEIIRAIGIPIAPLGAIIGVFKIGDERK